MNGVEDGGIHVERRLDAILDAVSSLRSEVSEMTAWVKAERERMDRVQTDLMHLRDRHETDLRAVLAREDLYATKSELAALESEMVTRQRWIVGLLVTILLAVAGAAITLFPHLGG